VVVYSKPYLSGAQKPSYMKTMIEPELLRPTTNADKNYELVWDSLNKRYCDIQQLVFTNMSWLVKGSLQQESAKGLGKPADVTSLNVKILDALTNS
jgi:hypothetical protein